MKIEVRDGAKVLGQLDFCSSYGKADAKIVTDSRERAYLALEYGDGHGPNAVTTYLSVYDVGSDLIELIRIPTSWPVGPTQRFYYSYEFKAEPAGLQIELIGADVAGAECCVPEDKIRTIELDDPKH